MSPTKFQSLADAVFGPYLAAHGFSHVDSASAPRVLTAKFRSSEFTLWLFGESTEDIYGKVAPINDEVAGEYLGAVLAYLSGANHPVRGAQAQANELQAHHAKVARLFAPDAHSERSHLKEWIADYAQRSVAELARKAEVVRESRRWWQFWLRRPTTPPA